MVKMATPQNQEGPSRSSSASLSSPPHTSPEPGSPSAQFANEASHSSITVNPVDVAVADKPVTPQPPARKKPGRKPKVPAPDAVNNTAEAPAKRKRNVKPKDPNAPPRERKKKTKDSLDSSAAADLKAVSGPPRQPKIIESNYQNLAEQQSKVQPQQQTIKDEAIPSRPSIQSFFNVPPPPQPSQPSQSSQPPPPQPLQPQQPPQQSQQSQQSQPQPPPPPQQPQQQPLRTSGQNYDPIRSNYDPVRETVVTHNHYPSSQGSPNQPPPSLNRASASPSISSLVDPPNQALASPSIAAQSFFNQQQLRLQRDENHNSVPPSPTTSRLAPSAIVEPSVTPKPPTPVVNKPVTASEETASKKPEGSRPNPSGPSTISKKSMGAGSTATSSAAASPKPVKNKDAKDIYPTPPPLPGSGLMGGLGQPNDGTEFRAPTVVLNIPMAGETNKYINFTKLAEEQYGWDALHPRLAAQRDRLARVAAAGAALERSGSNRESGDEMSLDSEGEGSNVEMGGMSDGRTGTDGGAKKVPRKRKMKEDEYDKDDGFVDDSELLWEEQAAATNDGFFVYSGPLVPEGEKPTLDTRGDGAPKRARGRGGRGGTTRAAGTRGGRGGSEAGTGRGGIPLTGPGSRGGSTTRKPRITKADRARMEQEKLDREKMGTMASMPGGYGAGMPQLAASMGNTPMVFNQ